MSVTRKNLEMIIYDIKSGNHYDLYISIAAAAVLVLLNIFSVVDQKYITSVLMASIAVLAYGVVGIKNTLNDIEEKVVPADMKPSFITEFPTEFRSQLDEANEILFSGTHLSYVLTAYHELITRKLERGGRIRFLIVNPNGSAAMMAAKRFPGKVPDDQEKHKIITSLAIMETIRKKYESQVEIRVLDFPIDYTAYYMNPDSSDAILYIERATYKISGGIHKPKHIYKRTDGKWFDHITSEIQIMWNDAVQWNESMATSAKKSQHTHRGQKEGGQQPIPPGLVPGS